MIHELKIKQRYLDRLLSGEKKAEIRINDRDYQVGDRLKFIRSVFSSKEGMFIDTPYLFDVTHIHQGLGVIPGYCVLSVELFDHKNEPITYAEPDIKAEILKQVDVAALDEDVKFIAMDEDCWVCSYDREPELRDDVWVRGYIDKNIMLPKVFSSQWKASLIDISKVKRNV